MRDGDTLYIKSIDRLELNKTQVKKYLEKFKNEGIRVKIIDLPTTMEDVPMGQERVIDMINKLIRQWLNRKEKRFYSVNE